MRITEGRAVRRDTVANARGGWKSGSESDGIFK